MRGERFLVNCKILKALRKYLQVHRVEEEHHVLALKVGEADLLKLPVDDGGALEGRGRLANLRVTSAGHGLGGC